MFVFVSAWNAKGSIYQQMTEPITSRALLQESVNRNRILPIPIFLNTYACLDPFPNPGTCAGKLQPANGESTLARLLRLNKSHSTHWFMSDLNRLVWVITQPQHRRLNPSIHYFFCVVFPFVKNSTNANFWHYLITALDSTGVSDTSPGPPALRFKASRMLDIRSVLSTELCDLQLQNSGTSEF